MPPASLPPPPTHHRSCLSKYYASWTKQELHERCPWCRGICCCRACLRKRSRDYTPPAFSTQEWRGHSKHLLAHLAPHVAAFLQREAAEARGRGPAAPLKQCFLGAP